jgi:hypothetical protein
MSAHRHLFVGDPQAVQILAGKILTKSREAPAWQRIVRAATKARARHEGVRTSMEFTKLLQPFVDGGHGILPQRTP